MNCTALLAVLGGVLLAACQWLIYCYAPMEQVMGEAQKIFYIHLPLAWWGLISFCLSGFFGACYLKTKKINHDLLSGVCAEVGMLCCTLTLITGSIWGRHSWGVWWTWDPRLTTALILWFIYAGYMLLRSMPMQPESRSSLCAVVSILGVLDVPLVFVSARLWRSIHPSVFASQGGGLEFEMAVAAIASVLCFGLFWFSLLAVRYSQYKMSSALDAEIYERMMRDEEK